MSVKPREELSRKSSQPPVDRFGVHFEYQDLCARLKEVEMQRNQTLNTSLKPLARKPSRALKNRSMQGTYGNPEQLKRLLRANDSNVSRGPLNRSLTPNKQMGRKVIVKSQMKLAKLKPKHVRQASLPMLPEQSLKAPFKMHKKSVSMAWNTHNIYSTVDFFAQHC